MDLTKAKIFVLNILIMLLGGIFIYISVYLGLKNYFGVIYIVPTGAVIFSFGIFMILVSFFLFFYRNYWNIIKEVIFQRLILRYKIFWFLIICFLGILFLGGLISSDFFNVFRSIPVFPIQIFESFSLFGQEWIYTFSIILRYSVGLWITVLLWYFILKKVFGKEGSTKKIQKQKIAKNTNDLIEYNVIINFANPLKTNHTNKKENLKQSFSKSSKIRKILLNKYIILFIAAFLLRFFVYFNANPGFDTGFYLALTKNVVQNNNFNIFFSNSFSNDVIMALPTCIPLIGFTYLTGGDSLLAASIYIPILSLIIMYLVIRIIAKATDSKVLPFIAGVFLAFSVLQLFLISGLYKQITTICITLIIIYILFLSKWKSLPKSFISILLIGLLLIIDLFYFLTIIVFLLIYINYLLIRKNLEWSIFKNSRLFLAIKIVFISGLIVTAGITTYLYSMHAFPYIDLSIFYFFFSTISTPPTSNLWTVIYNDIVLFAPFLFLLIFAVYGFISDYKKTHFKNKNFQIFLRLSFLICLIFVLADMFHLGLFYLDERFLLYFEFNLVIYASVGFVDIYSIIKSNYSNKIFFKTSKKIFMGIFVFCILLGSILTIPFYRLGALGPPEKDAMIWLLNNGKTEKLTNNLNFDVVIVSNNHLQYWIQYLINYNAINNRMYWRIDTILSIPVNQFIATANETIYFLVSKIREPHGETWQDIDVINYIIQINTTLNKNYFLIYNNSIVYIFEIEINKV